MHAPNLLFATTMKSMSRRVPGSYPAPGVSEIADRIRARRGARGLTPLDGTLLHVPPIADGWNKLLGAVRTAGKLGGNVRELMILRVAALNGAAFEWIQHEPVGRAEGLTTAQLHVIRDTSVSLTPASALLTSLQTAALAFTDASTKHIKVPDQIFATLRAELDRDDSGNGEDLVVEAVAVVATYNMVSRFLVSLDVAGKADELVPWPVDLTEHTIPIPNTSPPLSLNAVTLVSPSPERKWIVLVNSLLTTTHMWHRVTPGLLGAGYSILLYDQRGHGLSSVPEEDKAWTIEDLADDAALLIRALCHDERQSNEACPHVEAVIGVSLGGATALCIASRHPTLARRIVACDTQARTPGANVKAWDDRIKLAQEQGMEALAKVTVERWFPSSSIAELDEKQQHPDLEWVRTMVSSTPLAGFVPCARALQSYDLLSSPSGHSLLECQIPTLLIAGGRDGVLPATLLRLAQEWTRTLINSTGKDLQIEYGRIEGAGHLPMVDHPEEWVSCVLKFLRTELV